VLLSADWQLVAPIVRVTATVPKKILRESRSELLKPPLPIAELCRRNKRKILRMEVITMESSAYMALTEQIAEIASHIRKSEEKKAGLTDRQVGSAEAARILGISRRTLQRMRDGHRIRYTTLGGKCMYRLSEIDRFIMEHTVKEENGRRK
jgi:excisionase family DNA binding protein